MTIKQKREKKRRLPSQIQIDHSRGPDMKLVRKLRRDFPDATVETEGAFIRFTYANGGSVVIARSSSRSNISDQRPGASALGPAIRRDAGIGTIID